MESSDDDRPHQRHKADKRKPAKVVRAKTVTEDDFPAKGNLLRRRSTSCMNMSFILMDFAAFFAILLNTNLSCVLYLQCLVFIF